MSRAATTLLSLAVAAAAIAATNTETAGPTRALGLFKPGEPVPLVEGFRDPPAISRVQCWWQCHGSAFTRAEITRQLEEFKAKGFGGVTVKDTLAKERDERTAHIKDIPFLSPPWLDMFAHIVAECGRLGLICRCRLGSGWNAGGPWVTPAMSSQVLAFASSEAVTGPGKFAGPIPAGEGGAPALAALRGGDAFVLAVRQGDGRVVDLTAKVTAERTLAWAMPQGTWTVLSCFSKPSGVRVMSASPSGGGLHHDHLSTAGTDLQLRHVAERIRAKLGSFDGTAFDGFNCDSWELGTPTWTPGFRRAFIQRRGYDPVPCLPHLARVTDRRFRGSQIAGTLGETGGRFLWDLRLTVSDLINETHYARVAAWCRRHGVAFEAESGGPHTLPNDLLQGLGAVHIPMGEFWMRQRSNVKLPSSSAHAYGRRLVSLESFTDTRRGTHFAISPAQMKARVDEAFLLGGNTLCLAVTEYSPKEAGLPGWAHNAGPHLNHCQSWWPLARPFLDYLARCCFLLQSGRDVAHVAVYHSFRTAGGKLWHAPADDALARRPKAFAFDYVNDDLVQNHMAVRDGQIALKSGATYQILYVVPTAHPSLPLATMRKIRDLARDGATVVWGGTPPTACPGLAGAPKCDAELQAIFKQLRDSGRMAVHPTHDYKRLIPLLAKSPEPPAWRLTREGVPLRFVHRRTADADIFFVVNRATWDVATPVTFRIADRSPELWRPETGAIEPVHFHKAGGGTVVPMTLPARGAVFVVFRKGGGGLPKGGRGGTLPAPVDVVGPWTVTFPDGWGAPPEVTLPTLKSWSEHEEPGIRHFSGVATYAASFAWSLGAAASGQAVVLDLGRVAEVCEVRLNGQLVGHGWHPPYRFDVSRQIRTGDNRLTVRVANQWHNRLVGDAARPKARRVARIAPDTHCTRLKGAKLLPAGLLGPVRLTFVRQ